MRQFTPEELATARTMANAGHTRKEALARIRIAPASFDAQCKELGITFYVRPPSEHSPRREFTPCELALVRRESEAGASKRGTLKKVKMGFDQFTRLCREHGIVFAPEKKAAAAIEKKVTRLPSGPIPTAYPARRSRRELTIAPPADVIAWLEDTARITNRPVEAIVASMLEELVIDTVNSEAA